MNYLSVCAGIEAASVAWHPLGWNACLLSEIEKFPRRVLAHHYPSTRMWGDFTALRVRHLRRLGVPLPAILVGGTPCQAFSVAGARRSLADARGNLTLSFVRLAHALANTGSLRNVIWENVPGVLSTKDNAFGCFLGALVGADDAILPPGGRSWPDSGMVSGPKGRAAWTIKDAQYFGLAQRRRRVFVVADFGNGADPAAVLFEPASLLGNSPPRRETREGVAVCPTIRAGGNSTGGHRPPGTDVDTADSLVVTHAIQAGALRTNPISGPDGVGVQEGIAYTIEARAEVQAVCITGNVTHTLRAEGFDASEDGTGRGQPIVCVHGTQDPCTSTDVAFALQQNSGQENVICFSSKDHGADAAYDISPTLRACGHTNSHANAGAPPAVAFQSSQSGVRVDDVHATLDSNNGSRRHNGALLGSAVRRLTPRECERLQGFPDDYTKLPDYEPDGPRYKALGNSMAVPVMRWIGERVQRFMPANDNAREQSRAA